MSATGDHDAMGLATLPTLPIFFKVRRRRALIVGGGEPAVWKAEVLCAAGAEVEVVAAEICSGLHDLAARLGPAALRLTRRPWQESDLRGAALALGAIEEVSDAALFRDAARRVGVPVNVIDKPDFCDFQFGTLVARGPLVLAITTDGAAPVFGQAIRAQLEAWFPEGLAAWAQAAKNWRPRVQDRDWPFRRRRRFWETFAALALAQTNRMPTEGDLAECMAAAEGTPTVENGSVTLVGSGPGRSDGLTFAAARSLQTAEVLLFEAGLPPALVNLARREAPRRAVMDDASGATIAALEAAAGKSVVWLGTGNPTTCRRWRDRAERLACDGITAMRIGGLSNCLYCAGQCSG